MITTSVVAWSLSIGILAIGFILLLQWLKKQSIVVRWYEWLIGVIGLLLLLFTLQNFAVSFSEPPVKPWIFLAVFGIPAVILLGVAFQLVARRRNKAGA